MQTRISRASRPLGFLRGSRPLGFWGSWPLGFWGSRPRIFRILGLKASRILGLKASRIFLGAQGSDFSDFGFWGSRPPGFWISRGSRPPDVYKTKRIFSQGAPASTRRTQWGEPGGGLEDKSWIFVRTHFRAKKGVRRQSRHRAKSKEHRLANTPS